MIRFVLAVTFWVLCAAPAFADESPVIKAGDYPQGGGVTIAATDSLVLDARGVLFSSAHGEGFGPPDTIALHYIGDRVKGYYSMPYKSDEPLFTINAGNLTPRGNPPFPGFEAGAAVFLMVGREVPKGSLDLGMFADQWTLHISVKR